MKRSCLLLLLVPLASPSCETAHHAAVSTFRVIDAPHVYLRRQLGLDEQDQAQTTTTSTTVTTETNAPVDGEVPPQPYENAPPVVAAPPPPPPQRRSIVTERAPQSEAESRPAPTPTPRMASTNTSSTEPRRSEPKTTPSPRTVSSGQSDLPYAKPVPGKPGFVFSPYDKEGGYVDVKGFSPGSKVKDPYSGKIFLVP